MTEGQSFRWSLRDGSRSGTAVVLALRSDWQEGLGPEAEDYAARWMDARPAADFASSQTLTFMLGTDGRAYLDGQEVQLSFMQESET